MLGLLALSAAASTAAAPADSKPPAGDDDIDYKAKARTYGATTRGVAATETDFIVVGGGTAGCALAARLCSGLPGAHVTLLERGLPRNDTQEMAKRSLRMQVNTWLQPLITETWHSEPNAGLSGRAVDVIDGATLGGAAMNAAQWTQPAPSITAGWGIDGLDADAAVRLAGEARKAMHVDKPAKELWHTYTEDYLRAAIAAGIDVVYEPEAGTPQDSAWVNFLTADALTGHRIDSCTAYLSPVMDERHGVCTHNLQVVQGAVAEKVLLDKKGVATGVVAADAKTRESQTFRARKEVVLSSGPYGSAKLLQLSGIGPKPLIKSLGVPLVKDLPVGAAAQARPVAYAVGEYTSAPLAPENNSTLVFSDAEAEKFHNGEGGLLGVNFMNTNGISTVAGAYTFSSWAGFPPGSPQFSMDSKMLCALNPTSRATVEARSTDAFENPKVATNLLGDSDEAIRAAKCIKQLAGILNYFPEGYDFELQVPPAGTEASEELARATVGNAYHFVGACKVGSVLDSKLKVKGFDNLRVVDASAIPDIPEYAGPMASVVLLAEHAAEQMVQDHHNLTVLKHDSSDL